MKFRVGDHVMCKIRNRYRYTDFHVECIVVGVDNNNIISVIVPSLKGEIGYGPYKVHAENFVHAISDII